MTLEIPTEPENNLEQNVEQLEDMVAHPEKHGIFDDLGKKQLEEKLSKAREEYGRDLLGNR